jgi:hypothetical protein
MDNRCALWIRADFSDSVVHLRQELIAESGALILVPSEGILDISSGFSANDY